MIKDRPVRSFVKGVSWRFVGTVDTFFVAWLITGDIRTAGPIAVTEVATKVILYFLHERIWNQVNWGREKDKPSHMRSIAKGVSWRFFGTMDTIIISLIYSGHLIKSLSIGLTEVFTKIFLFYLHERLWAQIRWGRISDKKEVLTVPVIGEKNQ